jgi:hypothetical protein
MTLRRPHASWTRSARRRSLLWLGLSVLTLSAAIACEQGRVTLPQSEVPGVRPGPDQPSRWSSPGGERNSPATTGVTLDAVSAHDGSVAPISVPGTYTYRTIVRATYAGSVDRTWNIPDQPPAASVGPAGTGGTISWGSVVVGGGAISNGFVRSPDGTNVPTLTMYVPLQGNYTIGRSAIQQPSHDNPACGPQSSSPDFDCITHSGSGTTASFEAVDVALVGWANRSSANPEICSSSTSHRPQTSVA